MDEHIIKVTGDVNKEQLDKLLDELGKNGWIATNNVAVKVIEMSLREEIKNRVKEEHMWNNEMLTPDDKEKLSDEASKDIIKMFEERIDKRIEFINKNNTSDMGKYSVMELERLKGMLK